MTKLLELAERCEQAAGPDREIDGSIWWATLSLDAVAHFDRTWFVRECIERDGSAGRALAQFFDSSNPGCLARVAFEKRFTASLDAAMTLVPEGLDWMLDNFDGPVGQRCTAEVFLGADGLDSGKARAATPSLALCAAALRSLNASKGRV